MCDYSAEKASQRPAAVGDRLVLNKLTSHTLGFVTPEQPGKAVCLCTGTKVIVAVGRMLRELRPNLAGLPDTACATFDQREPTNKNRYRDGLIFDDLPGVHISLQHLSLWTKVSVEAIPGDSPEDEAPETPATAAVREPAFA
ncbi:MAG: hypothetical protein JWO84_251 [Parcubacteria group bacterium]|nr:hypothetical protein [Parcubacteria group bacterium]